MERNKWGVKYLKSLVILGILSGLIVASLIYSSHIVLHRTIETYQSGAALVNKSGRQRMLSQRIAVLSLQLVNTDNLTERGPIRKKLIHVIDLMDNTHNELTDKDSGLNQGKGLSLQVRKIYFSSPHYLNSKVQNFISEAKSLANTPDKPHLLDLLNISNEDLLPTLDIVTNWYQKEYETRIYSHEEREDRATALSISLLLGMALLVFLPVIRHLKAETIALSESEERYRSFVENFQGIAFKSKIDFAPLFFHGAVEDITGYTESDFINGKPGWDQVIHPDDLPIFLELAEKVRSAPDYSDKYQYRIIRKDGEIRWVHEIIQNICDDSGKPVMVQGYIYDMTEKKKVQELKDKTLKELEHFNRLAIGREKRMIELKSEVNELLRSKGREEKYRINGHEKQP